MNLHVKQQEPERFGRIFGKIEREKWKNREKLKKIQKKSKKIKNQLVRLGNVSVDIKIACHRRKGYGNAVELLGEHNLAAKTGIVTESWGLQ